MPSDRPPPFDLISGIARNEGAITTSSCLSRPLLPIVPLLHTMFFARRSVASLRPLLRNQQPRRLGSHAAHPAEPVNEGYGVCTCLTLSFYFLLFFAASNWVLSRLGYSHVRDVVELTVDRKSYSVVSMSPSEPSPRPSCSTDSTNPTESPARNHGFPASFRNIPPRRRSLRRETRSTLWLWKRLPLTVTCSRVRAPGKPLS